MSKNALVSFLVLLNVALAFALAVLVFEVLPYAAAVACGEVTPIPGCASLTKAEHYGLTITPLAVAAIIIFLALRLHEARPKLSNMLLILLPVAAAMLSLNILVSTSK